MRLHAYHGVMPQERVVGNDYVINIRVGYPWTKASETDDVADTLNYATLAELIKQEMAVQHNLVEMAASCIVKAVKAAFDEVTSVNLTLTKCAPPMSTDCDGAGVEINVTF